MVKAAFAHEIGGQRMMRGEQIMRTHPLVNVVSSTLPSGEGYALSAKVFSQHHASLAPGGAYSTSIIFSPMVDPMLAYYTMVSKGKGWWNKLVQAVRMGQKPLQEAQFKDEAALLIKAAPAHHESSVPRSWSLAATASCQCLDYKSNQEWCKHIAALAYVVIERCDADPFYPFELRGFNLYDFLKRMPFKRMRDEEAHRVEKGGDGSATSPIVLE